MNTINIREALLNIDKQTSCEYDLTTLYEACKLNDEDKHQLVKYIDAYDHPSVIGEFLASKCDGLSEAVEDDVTEGDMKKIIDDVNEGEDHTLWALMNKADNLDECVEEESELKEDSNWRTNPSNSKEVASYVYNKIRSDDNFTSDDSRYWYFDRAVSEGDDAVLVTEVSSVPNTAKYSFSMENDSVDMDFYVDQFADTWYVVDNNPSFLEEGLWDDIKKVGKAVGHEIKNSKVYQNNIGAAKTAIKNTVDKVKSTDAYKNISNAVKDTDTYKNVKGKVNAAKQTLRDTKADNNRKPEDYMETVKGKNYNVSDLTYTLNGKQITPDEYIKMNGFQRKRAKVTVPNGIRPIQEGMWDYELDESLTEDSKHVEFNDKYFPRVDIEDKSRYDYVNYKGRDFAYDKKNSMLIYLFKDDEEVADVGQDNAPWREIDAVRLSSDNWNNKEYRNDYLQAYIFDLDSESSYLAQDFIQNELPLYQSKDESLTEEDEPHTREQVEKDLNRLTKNFTVSDDVLVCGCKEEADYAKDTLKQYYSYVNVDKTGSWFKVAFSGRI